MANGIPTGTSGATAVKININYAHNTMNEEQYTLTPTDERDDDNVCFSDSDKHNDQLLEHEQSLCSHPHDSHQSEVVNEDGHCHTSTVHRCSLHTNHKHQQHEEHGNTQLDMELGGISFAKCSVWNIYYSIAVTNKEHAE